MGSGATPPGLVVVASFALATAWIVNANAQAPTRSGDAGDAPPAHAQPLETGEQESPARLGAGDASCNCRRIARRREGASRAVDKPAGAE